MSDAHKTFTALSEVKAAWIQKDLTKANYLEFDEAMLLAAQAALPDQENVVMGLLMTQAEWNTIPANVLGLNQFVPLPDIAQAPVAPDLPEAGAQVAVERMYERALLAYDKAVMQRLHLIQAAGFLKELYMNEVVLGAANQKAAVGGGNTRHACTPVPAPRDPPTFQPLRNGKRFTPPLQQTSLSQSEDISNTALALHHRALNPAQRMAAFAKCYEASPGVVTCIGDYRKQVPALAAQQFDHLLAYVTLQQLNIEQTLTRAAVGYGCEEQLAAAAMRTTKTHTQGQLDSAIAAAVAHAVRAQPATAPKKGTMYCWSHGYNSSHASADCLCCKPGGTMRSRYGYDGPTTRCFSHPDCDHSPPCISVANAKKATQPDSFPETPGRAAFYTTGHK
jgi:hypothetical protein